MDDVEDLPREGSIYKPMSKFNGIERPIGVRWNNVFGSGETYSRTLFKVPTDLTSDIPIKKKYPKHKYSSRVIDFALYCMDNNPELSLGDIAKAVSKKYNLTINFKSIWSWRKKFRPNLSFPKHRTHKEEWNTKISNGLKEYYKKNPPVKGKKRGSYKLKWMLQYSKLIEKESRLPSNPSNDKMEKQS